MPYDAASFKAGFALGRMLWRPPIPPPAVPPAGYLTFKSSADFSLEAYYATWDGIVEYSTDKVTWAEWDGDTIYSTNGALYLRGTGNTYITGPDISVGSQFRLMGNAVHCTGNIEMLLDYATVLQGEHPTMEDYCFAQMFRGLTALVEGPDTPCPTLSEGCYEQMYYGSGITSAKALPAATLTPYCYSEMYRSTPITAAPVIGATETDDYSCFAMFAGCTSLVTLSRLYSTDIADSCYKSMYASCSNLKLSYVQDGIYQYPFRIPDAGTGTAEWEALYSMFYGTGGTWSGTPQINTTYYTDHPIPT